MKIVSKVNVGKKPVYDLSVKDKEYQSENKDYNIKLKRKIKNNN